MDLVLPEWIVEVRPHCLVELEGVNIIGRHAPVRRIRESKLQLEQSQ